RVLLQLTSQGLSHQPITNPNPQIAHHPHLGTQPPISDPTLVRIAELESQLAQLRAQKEAERVGIEPNPVGMLNPTHAPIAYHSESASGIIDSVETMFPGVERTTLVQIIENRFKPTNIHRLLASEKERAETHRMINIGGV